MKKIGCLVIDDTNDVLETMALLLNNYFENEIELLATYNNGNDGLKGIIKYQPDVVFLDIEMPELSGFELKTLIPKNINSKIIIITGKESYALNAIKHSVFDFLVKPISLVELRKCINKITESFNENKLNKIQSETDFKTLIVNRQDKTIVLDISSISKIEANGACAIIFYNEKKISSTKSFKHYENTLMNHQFIKVHRSCMVNINQIKEIIKNDGEGRVLLKDGTEIELSKAKKDELVNKLIALKLI